MIKEFSVKKILKYTVLLLIVFLFYLFPEKEKVSLNEPAFEETNKVSHDIYLIDKNNYISKTSVAVNSTNKEELIEELIEVLIIDGKYESRMPNGFSAILPVDTRLLDKKIEDNTVILNFNNDLLDTKKEYEEKMIESIIYTITSIDGINSVKINVDRKRLEKLPKTGKLLDEVLTRNFGINKKYDVNTIDNISKVTIYYTNKNNNDEIYYIPVTKYMNSNEEKIKIIVDELTSKISYESNLMSYLNYNAKLLDYSFNDDELDLNFNEYLFDSIQNQKVLEEVIYSISYSIMDNYEVSKINFYVNNKEI